MALDGIGDLHAAFEQLKSKLAAQGLFAESHKQQLPHYPKTIAIITSPAGAAIHDMLRILRKRYPLAQVRLLPVRVQGTEAPAEIAAAIAYANEYRLGDLLIVGRGGGSIEDLWAFNEEIVAYAIYNSKIPVISAVGHEPDVTIADYVADMRAATPSNAAELAVPDQEALRQNLDMSMSAMATALQRLLKASRQHLNALAASPTLQSPEIYLLQRRKALEFLSNRLAAALAQQLSGHRQRFLSNTAKLDAMSPLKVLTRGYSMAHNMDKVIIHSVKQVAIDDTICLTVSDGNITAKVTGMKENSE